MSTKHQGKGIAGAGNATDVEACAYLAGMASELARMASDHNLPVACYLFTLASMEARKSRLKRLSEHRGQADPHCA